MSFNTNSKSLVSAWTEGKVSSVEVANFLLLFEDLRDSPLATLPCEIIDELGRISVTAPETEADWRQYGVFQPGGDWLLEPESQSSCLSTDLSRQFYRQNVEYIRTKRVNDA